MKSVHTHSIEREREDVRDARISIKLERKFIKLMFQSHRIECEDNSTLAERAAPNLEFLYVRNTADNKAKWVEKMVQIEHKAQREHTKEIC